MTDFLASIGVGISQILVGHPFDTSKVLIQNKKKWLGLPIKDYYRGFRFPLVSATLFNCTVFPIYNRTMEYTQSGILSGLLAGIAVSPIVYFSDVGKIRQQTKQKLKLNHFIKSKGKLSVISRETIAMTTYFGLYDYLKNQNYHPLISGGLCGLANWTLTYPIDVVKSRQIAQNITISQAIKIGHLWKGYPICAIRAVLVNSSCFYVYETLMKLLN